jgi:hypothetical protein
MILSKKIVLRKSVVIFKIYNILKDKYQIVLEQIKDILQDIANKKLDVTNIFLEY